ncbi:MAG: hypothetical protein ACOY5B_08045 [Spirochaetota bacterium]
MQDSQAEPGHTIFYLAGEDSAADRHNTALLARIARLSTTPVHIEIFYHRPLQLSNWAIETGNVRYTRLRSASEFALAERIAAARTQSVLYFNFMLLVHAEDIWLLLGHTSREPYALALPGNTLASRGEGTWSFALRSARFDLSRYTGSHSEPAIIAVNRNLLQQKSGRQSSGLLLRKFYADLLSGAESPAPLLLRGRSYAIEARPALWLTTLRNTVFAFNTWRDSQRFPWWFSHRHPLFLVAQLSFYAALLVLPVSATGSHILALFTLGTTLPYFLRGFLRAMAASLRNGRHTPVFLRRTAARMLLYLIG